AKPYTQPGWVVVGPRWVLGWWFPRSQVRHGSHTLADVAVFLVERSLPGMMAQDLRPAATALEQSCQRLAPRQVRHLRTLLILGGSRCISLFEAESKDLVMRANSDAQFPFTTIEEVTQIVSRNGEE